MCAAALILASGALLAAAEPAAPAAASPDPKGEQIKAAHREAAQKFLDQMSKGVMLSGTVDQNGSKGEFKAYFLNGESYVRQAFGEVDSITYSGAQGYWTSSSTSLPYQFEAQDNPANMSLSLLSDGSYMEEPNWSLFTYSGEDAGGYNFEFRPVGLPAVKIVLYADPEEPQYLQLMSAEIQLSPNDRHSSTYRSYYYYQSGPNNGIYTQRETGRELDSSGRTVSFSDYNVTEIAPMTALPAEAQFDFERKPPGNAGSTMTAPVDIPVDTSKAYFLVPITFEGSDKTWVFLFDTGASASLLSPAAAAAAKLGEDLLVPGHGHGTTVDFHVGLCKTASLGRADAPPEQHVALTPFPAASISESNRDVLEALASYGADGIVGVSLLEQYVMTLDHGASKITVIPKQLFDMNTMVKRPNIEYILDAEDLLYITGAVKDGQGKALKGDIALDSGLQINLALLRETVEFEGLSLEHVGQRNNTVLGGVRQFDYVKVPLFDLGPLSWTDVIASLTEDDNGSLSGRGALGFVGVPLFFGSRVTIDLFAQRMYIEPGDPEKFKQQMEGGPAKEEEKKPEEKSGGSELPVNIGLVGGERNHA